MIQLIDKKKNKKKEYLTLSEMYRHNKAIKCICYGSLRNYFSKNKTNIYENETIIIKKINKNGK